MEYDGISSDTQAALLLHAYLGKGKAEPLTLMQFNVFEEKLAEKGYRLSDLLKDESIADIICTEISGDKRIRKPVGTEQVRSLLRRGVSLSVARDRWDSLDIRVAGRTDPLYPQRMKDHLGNKAPPFLFYAGNEELFAGGGTAFVGSRDAPESCLETVRSVAEMCVKKGMNIISGGARGVDTVSMEKGMQCGGNVIGALGNDLSRAVTDRKNFTALSEGRLLLFSYVDPDAGFRPSSAMDRNKYIYAIADRCFVARSGTDGGTWEGAVEELKRENHIPVLVNIPDDVPAGNLALVERGGIPWNQGESFEEVLSRIEGINVPEKKAVPRKKGPCTLDDF